MRIGFILYGSLETLTGGYLYDRIVVRGLVGLGHEVEVISLRGGSYLRKLRQGFSGALCRRLVQGGFDLLIEDGLCHPSLFELNRRLRRQSGPPVVALVHQVLCRQPRPGWQNRFFSLAERSFLASVDGFIHNSQATRRTVASLVDYNRPQVVAYPAGDRFGPPLGTQVIAERSCRPGPLELLFLGHLLPGKGLLPLLEALAAVDRSVWHLSIAGSPDFDRAYAGRAVRLTRRLGLTDSVRFLGTLRNEGLAEILRTSHLFCMPYAHEGFGMALLEGMAFGLPALGSLQGAAGETIRPGINGFLLAPGDLEGLKPLLTRLHRDRKGLLRLALAARETFINSPTWQECVQTIDRFVGEMKKVPVRQL